ncbi:MAG TPA: hypothetical protein VJQ46_03015 [Gemmatimonadales bacterium]|nr:hypothetical protein [Gemmatimonadales bacterium]
MIALLLLLQTAQAPVLAFPERGLDDPTAYQGYQTRFYRDGAGNTVQIYLEPRGSRVVNLWADAMDESVGFTVRDAAGAPARLDWAADSATTGGTDNERTLEWRLAIHASRATIGWFLLGTMRVERDFQYAKAHLKPFSAPPFHVAEESLLVANIARLPAEERERHLTLLGAGSVAALRARLLPSVAGRCAAVCRVRIERPSLDGRNHLALELSVDPREATMQVGTRTVTFRSRTRAPLRLTVRIGTDGAPLTPLARDSIFTRPFLDFLASAQADTAGGRGRRLEREVRGVELLSSEEKLMAGLPNFATYFGRDMLMAALMMRSIWLPAMSEHVIASTLRKLSPRGDVSHEEALGGQAIRENAGEYNRLLAAYFAAASRDPGAAGDTLARARDVLAHLSRTRENYHMLDDEFQLPVLEARYLADSTIPAVRKRAFLLQADSGGVTRLGLMLREMALVAEETRAYAQDPRPSNLVSFERLDSTRWRSSSWRDSDAGYAGGRYAMDINAIWAPRALEAISTILGTLPRIGIERTTLDSLVPTERAGALAAYRADTTALRRAIETWHGARQHFLVTLAPDDVSRRLAAKLAWMSAAERAYWRSALAANGGIRDSLTFLALSLDSVGTPIPVLNTDPATELFLDATSSGNVAMDQVPPMLRPYPVGLLVKQLGPLVANDAYADQRVWNTFAKDSYHGPRVVWGREVNLLLLGFAAVQRGAARADLAQQAADASRQILEAVRASGLEHSELWSYRIEGQRLIPTRYGIASDVQLWSTTDLAVQFLREGR